ncbi:hypothetical protein AAZX31_14G049700 [Glycine max]|uniref:uncharacterized protein LOC114382981 isoform X2 n=1 Tax=Glycine soja TaxID=3848 RepID=UPI00103CDC37|nr:uncharacterized protein LOC114382981 isoform X2 [Glycine soja]KAH1211779.1 Heavy metal-associated isoprenylated plant protein 16 [Glycine max]
MKRIVIKVQLETDKCRSKALKIAAKSQGVQSLSLEEESNNDQVVVIGNDVDPVCLVNQLRKKFRYATLLSVEDLEEGDEGGQDGGGEEEEAETETEEVTQKEPHYDNYHIPNCPIYTNSTYVPPSPICTTYLPTCPMCATATYFPPSAPMYRPRVYDSYPNSCTIL